MNIKQLDRLILNLRTAADELDKALMIFRAEDEVLGGDNNPLKDDERHMVEAIVQRKDPVFYADLLQASDISEAMLRIYPGRISTYNPSRIGRILKRSGRYHQLTGYDGERTYRLWVLRNVQGYAIRNTKDIYREYAKQIRDALPPGYDELAAKKRLVDDGNEGVSFI